MPESFNKARRNLALFSGLLIAWEYIGFGFQSKDGSAVTGKLFGDIEVTIRNPEVLPVVIVVLVLYFAFRLSIEWNQCPPGRKALPASNIDLYVSYTIAMMAIVLFAMQQAFGFRVAGLLTPDSFIIALFTAYCYTVAFKSVEARLQRIDRGLGEPEGVPILVLIVRRATLPSWILRYVYERRDRNFFVSLFISAFFVYVLIFSIACLFPVIYLLHFYTGFGASIISTWGRISNDFIVMDLVATFCVSLIISHVVCYSLLRLGFNRLKAR